MSLPNIKNTWAPMGIHVKSFDDWTLAQSNSFVDDNGLKLAYLNDLYLQRADYVSKSPIGDTCTFARELRLAIDQMCVAQSSEYADKLIRGERLSHNLHEDYVSQTKCYG